MGLRCGRGPAKERSSGKALRVWASQEGGVWKFSWGRGGLWSVCTTYWEELRGEREPVYIEPLLFICSENVF